MPELRRRPRVFALEPALHAWRHWGDFADVLVHGMTRRRENLDEPIGLERAGPFVPAVTFPGRADVLVTEAARARLTDLVSELRFRPVVLAHVVRLDWQDWDASLAAPPRIPPSGDPADYLRDAPHDREIAESLGPVWEVVADVDHGIEGDAGSYWADDYCGQPLVRAEWWGGRNFVSEEFRDALLEVAPECVSFERARRARKP
jgi:hypothetical protein